MTAGPAQGLGGRSRRESAGCVGSVRSGRLRPGPVRRLPAASARVSAEMPRARTVPGTSPPTPRPYLFRFEPRHRALSGYTRPPPPPPRRRKRVGRPADTPHSNVKLRRYGDTQLRPGLGVWKWAAGYRSSRTNVPTILGLELTREPDTHQPKTTLPCSCFRAMWVTPTARRT